MSTQPDRRDAGCAGCVSCPAGSCRRYQNNVPALTLEEAIEQKKRQQQPVEHHEPSDSFSFSTEAPKSSINDIKDAVSKLYPDRDIMHKQMGAAEDFPCCDGKGIVLVPVEGTEDDYIPDIREKYCVCEAGQKRQQLESN